MVCVKTNLEYHTEIKHQRDTSSSTTHVCLQMTGTTDNKLNQKLKRIFLGKKENSIDKVNIVQLVNFSRTKIDIKDFLGL